MKLITLYSHAKFRAVPSVFTCNEANSCKHLHLWVTFDLPLSAHELTAYQLGSITRNIKLPLVATCNIGLSGLLLVISLK